MSASICTSRATLASATGTPDHDEVIRVRENAFRDAMKMVRNGEIIDAKTIAGLYRARDLLDS